MNKKEPAVNLILLFILIFILNITVVFAEKSTRCQAIYEDNDEISIKSLNDIECITVTQSIDNESYNGYITPRSKDKNEKVITAAISIVLIIIILFFLQRSFQKAEK